MVALRHEKLLVRRISGLLARRGAIEHRRRGEHGDDCKDFGTAAEVGAGEEHLGEGRVEGELHHFAAQLRELACSARMPWNQSRR